MYKDYTIEDVTKMVNCCYFVGSCRMCPFFKRSGFANIGKCSGEKEVGKALLGILEPLLEAEKAKKQPTLFEMDEGPDMDEINADPVEAETIAEDPEEFPADEQTVDPEAEVHAQAEEDACELIKDMVNLDALSCLEDPEA